MSTATLIRNGRIVTAVDDYVADILIEGGRIQSIGKNLPAGPEVGLLMVQLGRETVV